MRASVHGFIAVAVLGVLAIAQAEAAITGTYSVSATVTSPTPQTAIGPVNDVEVNSNVNEFEDSFPFFLEAVLSDQLQITTAFSADPPGATSYPVRATLEFTDFDLVDNGVPLVVTGATFDEDTSDLDQYFAIADFFGPVVSFANNTLTIDLGYDSADMAGDAPLLYFDLATRPVPIPAALPLLGSALLGLAGLGFARRTKA